MSHHTDNLHRYSGVLLRKCKLSDVLARDTSTTLFYYCAWKESFDIPKMPLSSRRRRQLADAG